MGTSLLVGASGLADVVGGRTPAGGAGVVVADTEAMCPAVRDVTAAGLRWRRVTSSLAVAVVRGLEFGF